MIFGRANRTKKYRRFSSVAVIFAIYLTMSVGCTKNTPVTKVVYLRADAVKRSVSEPEITAIEQWQRLVDENRSATLRQKLVSVNLFFNRFDHIEDRQLWGQDDYWATLSETLEKSGGDCEDVTIAKYFTLLDLGIPDEHMRITYVMSLKTAKPHMVLTLSPDSSDEPIVLDSMIDYLFPVSMRTDLVPVFSFNTKGYWLARKELAWQGEFLGRADRLSRWRNVLQRKDNPGG